MATINLWVKTRILLEIGKEKTIEVRCGYPKIRTIKVGDILRFNNDRSKDQVVLAVRVYQSFSEMLEAEDFKKIYPGVGSKEELLSVLKSVFLPDKEKLGVYAIEHQNIGKAQQ